VAAPADTSAPSISGTPSDGATLTANNGTWFGSAPINYGYQWQRCASDGTSCQDITDATSATYDVLPSDMGSSLRLQVTATNSVGTTSAHSDATPAVSASSPANTSAPSISGTMREGSMLSADKGSWTGTDPITYAYQWRRCNSDGSGCSDVAGATDNNYVLSTSDSGKAIEVRVTGTNDAGSSSARSPQVLLRAPLFAEGFESGLTRWTNFGLTTQQSDAFAGSWSAHAVSTGSPTYATANLPSAQSDLTYRLHFKGNTLTWPSTGVYLLKLRTATNVSIVGVYADKLGRLSYRNDIGAIAVTSSTVLTPFDWHELAVHVTIAGTSGSIDMTLDGTHVPSFPKTENFGAGLVGKIQVGDNSSGRTFDVTSDEVIVDNGS
jgi:hypothetical protein